MAKDKTSFILYSDLISVVKKLVLKDREEKTNHAGELFLHILEYVNDNEPIPVSFIVDMAFEPIKLTLKRDLKKYEVYIEKQRENGSKGGRPKNNPLTDSFGNIIPKTSNHGHFIYLMYDAVRGLYKIGETSDLIQRRYDIKQPTENLSIFTFGMDNAFICQKIETEILNLYKEKNISGDWFQFNKSDVLNIKNIISEKTQPFLKYPKKADSDSVSVIDSVNENIKILNNSLLSEIKISDDKKFFLVKDLKFEINEETLMHYKTALGFQKLFIKNLKEKQSPTSQTENATYKNFVDPIRLIFEKEEATKEQLREAYEYLNSKEGEFWKSNVLSTKKLREKLSMIILKKNTKVIDLHKKEVSVPDPNKRKRIT